MRISAKGQYALAALIQIAYKKESAEPVPVTGISEALGVSKIFLEQVATALKKAGLITAVKGARGGYLLTRAPGDITALEVLQSVENALFEATQNDPLEQVPIISGALSALVFTPLDRAVEASLSGVTLADLVAHTLDQGDSQSFMLYI